MRQKKVPNIQYSQLGGTNVATSTPIRRKEPPNTPKKYNTDFIKPAINSVSAADSSSTITSISRLNKKTTLVSSLPVVGLALRPPW